MKKLFIMLFAVISMFVMSASYAGFNVDVGVDAPDQTFMAYMQSDTGQVPDIGVGNSDTYSKTSTDSGPDRRISRHAAPLVAGLPSTANPSPDYGALA